MVAKLVSIFSAAFDFRFVELGAAHDPLTGKMTGSARGSRLFTGHHASAYHEISAEPTTFPAPPAPPMLLPLMLPPSSLPSVVREQTPFWVWLIVLIVGLLLVLLLGLTTFEYRKKEKQKEKQFQEQFQERRKQFQEKRKGRNQRGFELLTYELDAETEFA